MTAIVTLLSGLAVLAGSVANSEAQRFADSMILKLLGARRVDIIIAWILEYSLLAVLTGMVAIVIGTATSYALIHFFIGADFNFNLPLIALTAFSGAAFTICGLAGECEHWVASLPRSCVKLSSNKKYFRISDFL